MSSPDKPRPRILITRPVEDAAGLAEALARNGFDSLIEPMLSIVREPIAVDAISQDISTCQAVLVTSANGIRALASLIDDRHVPILAVGDASGAVSRDLGFGNVHAAGGNVEALTRLIKAEADAGRLLPSKGPLFHPAGSAVAGDLKSSVERLGFSLSRHVLYHANKTATLTPRCISAFRSREIAGATFLSPRTARHFVRLAREAGIEDDCAAVDAFALSPAVEEALQPLSWRTVYACAVPEQSMLIENISTALA